MKKFRTAFWAALVLLPAARPQETGPAISAAVANDVYVLPIHGEIDLTQAAFVNRGVGEILKQRPSLVVLDVDTPGGAVSDTMRIVGLLARVTEAKIPMVTFVSEADELGAAYSAGAIISMCSPSPMFMNPRSAIGAAEVIIMTTEGMESAPEKMNSAFRAKFSAVAKAGGYNDEIALAMVDKRVVLNKVKVDGKLDAMTFERASRLKKEGRVVETVQVGWDSDEELLTLDAKEAEELGFARLAADRQEVYRLLGRTGMKESVAQRTWSEQFVGIVTNGTVSVILMVVGLVGIWVEFKSPGLGAPGVIGVAALGLFLFGHHLAGLAQFTEIVLVVAGVILLALELFIFPGTLVCGGLGLLCMMAGVIMAMQDFVIPDAISAPWQVDTLLGGLLRMLLGFCSALVVFFLMVPKIARSSPLALSTTLSTAEGFVAPGGAEASLVGARGKALTDLRPGGRVEIDGRVYDVVTDGGYVEKGAAVVVKAVDSNRIQVTQA